MIRSGKCMLLMLLLAATLGSLSAQNPFKGFRTGAITAIGKTHDMISIGASARSERSLKGDFFEMGGAIKPLVSRRKRRFIDTLGNEQQLVPVDSAAQPYLPNFILRRGKRAPCMSGGGGGAGGGDAGDAGAEEIARYMSQRRRNSAQYRKRTRSTNNGSKRTSSRNRQIVTRRRRQADDADVADGSEFSRKAQQVAEKIQGVVKSAVGAMTDFAETVKQSFKDQNVE